jgi:hypothetical protein
VNIWNEKNEVFTQLKEKRILRKVLNKIPYLNLILPLIIRKKDKYDIYNNDEKVGSLEWYLSFKTNVVYVKYGKKHYEVYNKAKGKLNRFYVFEDQKQIGIIDKDYITKWNADRYVGDFNNDTDELLNIIIMLFLDLSMYTEDTSNRLESRSREYTLWQISNKKLNVLLNDEWKSDEINSR